MLRHLWCIYNQRTAWIQTTLYMNIKLACSADHQCTTEYKKHQNSVAINAFSTYDGLQVSSSFSQRADCWWLECIRMANTSAQPLVESDVLLFCNRSILSSRHLRVACILSMEARSWSRMSQKWSSSQTHLKHWWDTMSWGRKKMPGKTVDAPSRPRGKWKHTRGLDHKKWYYVIFNYNKRLHQ